MLRFFGAISAVFFVCYWVAFFAGWLDPPRDQDDPPEQKHQPKPKPEPLAVTPEPERELVS